MTECVPSAVRSCGEAGLLGTCATGTQSCSSDGKWGSCSVTPKPKDACVTGNDDSCNGVANEGCGCVIGAERPCAGAMGNCVSGKQTCPDGNWSACSIAPKTQDTCTPGDDANCNGKPNEGCVCTSGATQACGPTAVGNCKPGTSTCSGGAWGACVGAVVATARDCTSGLDNDCNGIADNTLDGVCQCSPTHTQACTSHPALAGKGICKAGSQTCVASSAKTSSSWGTCAGEVVPATRNCSATNADNDCNGIIDAQDTDTCKCLPGAKQACGTHSGLDGKGICSAGSQTCVTGTTTASSSWNATCTGSVGPAARDCSSSKDNDCNGVVDNTKDSVCQCNPTVSNSCAGGTKCQSSGAAAQCVTCLANTDCSNGGTCSSAGACACSARFNGPHCEFQVFRGFGALPATNIYSQALGINQDGSVVVGLSVNASGNNAVRSVNGGALQLIQANDYALGASAGTVLLASGALYTAANGVTLPNLSPSGGGVGDLSSDGTTMVGTTQAGQAFRKVGSAAPAPLGVLAGGTSAANATSGDGSVVVGSATNATGDNVAVRWTAGTGLVALPALSGWVSYQASDVSTDGKVIVGLVTDPNFLIVKWSGTALTPVALSPADGFDNLRVNGDGSVVVGTVSSTATIWNSAGQKTVLSLLGSTTDVSGWTLRNATGVSDDGKFIVGIGAHGSVTEGWVAHLP